MSPLQSQLNANDDYHLSLYEVCEKLGKSSRTITRYIRRHILHPRGVKSKQGTLEYRFSASEIEAFRQKSQEAQWYSIEQGSGLRRVPLASFASLDYGAPPVTPPPQTPFIIPGISYPLAQPPEIPLSNQALPDIDDVPEQTAPGAGNNPSTLSETNANYDRGKNEEIIEMLRETTGMLRDQLKVKDDQIKNLDNKIGQLIERNRETNILLKGLQDKIVMLEKPKEAPQEPNRTDQSQPQESPDPIIPVPAPKNSVPAVNDGQIAVAANSAEQKRGFFNKMFN